MTDENPTEPETYDLRVRWMKKDRDIVYDGPCGPDRHLMHNALTAKRLRTDDGFDPSLQDELILRGYDITTLKISVRRFKHPWIQRAAFVWHRKTGEKLRVHHVRWEQGVAYVRLMRPTEAFGSIDVPRDVQTDGCYRSIEEIERDYQATAPLPLKALLAGEGCGL